MRVLRVGLADADEGSNIDADAGTRALHTTSSGFGVLNETRTNDLAFLAGTKIAGQSKCDFASAAFSL